MDIKMHYIEAGEGPALIMIHGNNESSEYFVNQMEFFKDRFHCIAPDSRAHGKTPRGTEPLTIRQMAADVVGLMDELGIEKADILGFSDGGNIGLIMAMDYPERVNRLIANGPNLDLTGVPPELEEYVRNEYKTAKDNGDELAAEIINLMIDDPAIDPEDLKKVQCETIVVGGTEDLILKEHMEMIADKVGGKFYLVEGDHWCAGKNPEAFNEIAGEFLK